MTKTLTIKVDKDKATKLLEEYFTFRGDESFYNHLADYLIECLIMALKEEKE